jgi:hypothetical protein
MSSVSEGGPEKVDCLVEDWERLRVHTMLDVRSQGELRVCKEVG